MLKSFLHTRKSALFIRILFKADSHCFPEVAGARKLLICAWAITMCSGNASHSRKYKTCSGSVRTFFALYFAVSGRTFWIARMAAPKTMIARIRTANDAEMVIPTLWDMGLPIKACYFPVVRLIPASDRSKNKRAALPQPFDFLGGQSRN